MQTSLEQCSISVPSQLEAFPDYCNQSGRRNSAGPACRDTFAFFRRLVSERKAGVRRQLRMCPVLQAQVAGKNNRASLMPPADSPLELLQENSNVHAPLGGEDGNLRAGSRREGDTINLLRQIISLRIGDTSALRAAVSEAGVDRMECLQS